MNTHSSRPAVHAAFTLIELLMVITIIAILVGLLIPAIQIAKTMVYKAQAGSAAAQITASVRHYYTDYGKYPLGNKTPDPSAPVDVLFGGTDASNQIVFDILRNIRTEPGKPNPGNPQGIVYFETRLVSDPHAPRSGFATEDAGNGVTAGSYVDPWGNQYRIAIDADSDNKVTNLPYSDFKDAKAPPVGVAVFSLGKDGALGKNGDGIYRSNGTASDDILSWQ